MPASAPAPAPAPVEIAAAVASVALLVLAPTLGDALPTFDGGTDGVGGFLLATDDLAVGGSEGSG